MNKPVAWMFEYGTDRGDAVNGISWYPNVHFKKPDLGGLIRNIEPLYTHPVKEQSNLDNVVKNHIEDLVRCVKLFRSYEMDNTADEMEVAIKELEHAIDTHPVKEPTWKQEDEDRLDDALEKAYGFRPHRELTDEEIMEIVADKYEKGHGRYIDSKLFFVEFAKAILRKAQEK